MSRTIVIALYNNGEILGAFDTWNKAERAVIKQLKKFYREQFPKKEQWILHHFKSDIEHLKEYGNISGFAYLQTIVIDNIYNPEG